MNIRVDLNCPIQDGTEVVFRSPVDCSQVTGLKVYHLDASQEFMFADAHGNNVGDIDHLFAENVVVKVILDVTTGMAFVQNADTNAYIEKTFVKTVNGKAPDKNGNVPVETGGGGSTLVVIPEDQEYSVDDIRNAVISGRNVVLEDGDGLLMPLTRIEQEYAVFSWIDPSSGDTMTYKIDQHCLHTLKITKMAMADNVPTDAYINSLIDKKLADFVNVAEVGA